MKDQIMNRIQRMLHSPLTAFGCFLLGSIVNGVLVMGADQDWAYGIELILAVVGITAAFLSLRTKWVKYVAVFLLAIMILDSGTGIIHAFHSPQAASASTANVSATAKPSAAGTSAQSTSTPKTTSATATPAYRQTQYTYGVTGVTGTGYTSATTSQICLYCSGTGKCHLCGGKGYEYCNGPSCLNGRCTSCNGAGRYKNGSYTSTCIVCSGDGYCNICSGTNRVKCTWCFGGSCSHCNGTGKKN